MRLHCVLVGVLATLAGGCGSDETTGGSGGQPAAGGSSGSGGSGGSSTGGIAGTSSGGSGGSGATGGAAGSGGGTGGVPSGPACASAGPNVTSFQDSGAIVAESGQTYSGLHITNPNGPCITLTNVSNVTITESNIGPCGGGAAIEVTGTSSNITISKNEIHDSPRGVLSNAASQVTTEANRIFDIDGSFPEGTAIEYDYMESAGSIVGNCISGTFGSDVISGFQSSNLAILNNHVEVTITLDSAAGFTIGDSVNGSPGHDNHVSKNVVIQTGGVPPGVFGSSGNTLLDYNCLPSGIQAYAYNGPFVGVTVENNSIGPGSFVPDENAVTGWENNTFTEAGAGCTEAP